MCTRTPASVRSFDGWPVMKRWLMRAAVGEGADEGGELRDGGGQGGGGDGDGGDDGGGDDGGGDDGGGDD
eukprot:1009866-Pleurochrysis_carterae.AAC.1